MGGKGSGGSRLGAGRKGQAWHENQDACGVWASRLGAEMLAAERVRRTAEAARLEFIERIRTQGVELVRQFGDATLAACNEFSRVTGFELALSKVSDGFLVQSAASDFFRVTPQLAEAPQGLAIETQFGAGPEIGFVDDGAVRLSVDGEKCSPAAAARRALEPWLRCLDLSVVAEPVARNRSSAAGELTR